MSNTKIEWTDWSWNPVTGCTPISEGCAHCYAKKMAQRFRGRFGYPADDPFRVTFHSERLELPLRMRKPRKIFVNSMGDFFHIAVKHYWIDAVLEVIAATPQHTYQILTKRAKYIEDKLYGYSGDSPVRSLGGGDYLSNIWLGVTVENAKHKDRIDILRKIPAAVRFISFEPLLGDVGELDLTGIRWVIVGGETGPGAREMAYKWVANIFEQSKDRGIPFFFKKRGSWYNWGKDVESNLYGRLWREFPQTR